MSTRKEVLAEAMVHIDFGLDRDLTGVTIASYGPDGNITFTTQEIKEFIDERNLQERAHRVALRTTARPPRPMLGRPNPRGKWWLR